MENILNFTIYLGLLAYIVVSIVTMLLWAWPELLNHIVRAWKSLRDCQCDAHNLKLKADRAR